MKSVDLTETYACANFRTSRYGARIHVEDAEFSIGDAGVEASKKTWSFSL